MMTTYLVTVGLIFSIMLAGIAIERAYRHFAARNPHLGPFRKTNCGSCSCHGDSCDALPQSGDTTTQPAPDRH